MSHHESTTRKRELERLKSLLSMQILQTPIEQRYEQITELLRTMFDVPVSALSFVDRHRQWFKSIQGLKVEQTLRSIAFCQRTVSLNRVTVIPDARFDEHFGSSELVTGDPGIVFYAGAPVHAPDGQPVASLCIIGFEPRSLDEREISLLRQMAQLTEMLLHTPRASRTENSLLEHIGESWRSVMIDPLTRVWNAEGIKMLIQESVDQAEDQRERVGIAMLQLTGLDEYRKRFGHPSCDELIIRFTRAALKSMKAFDSIGRLRGGEFGVLMNRVCSRDDLYDRSVMLQMIADDLTHTHCDPPLRIGARLASVLVHPNHTTSAAQAMEQVECMLAGVTGTGDSLPLIAESDIVPGSFTRHHDAA